MERINVMYVTEEEKKAILRQRLEAERKANKKRMTAYERQYRILGVIMLIMALFCLYIGGEMIIGTILCSFFAVIGLLAREEDKMEWTEE